MITNTHKLQAKFIILFFYKDMPTFAFNRATAHVQVHAETLREYTDSRRIHLQIALKKSTANFTDNHFHHANKSV